MYNDFKNFYFEFIRWLQAVRQHLQQQHKLKKCDVEAQVMTDETNSGATPLPASLEQEVLQANTLHQQQTHTGNDVAAPNDHHNNMQSLAQITTNYHTIDNNSTADHQNTLAIFTINEVQTGQQDIFAYQ